MIPRVPFTSLVPVDIAIQSMERDSFVDGNVAPIEIDIISRLVRFHGPEVLFEIGTFDGRTTLNMAAHSSPSARVYTLDLPPAKVRETALRLEFGEELFINKERSGDRFAGTALNNKITQLYGDSATFDFSPYFGTVGFIFIDGSHSYDYVMEDTKTAVRLLRPGGVILWHDYVATGPTPWPGVTRAIKELYSTDPLFRNMKHILDTSIVFLQVPDGSDASAMTPLQSQVAGDSRQPGYLSADLSVDLKTPRVATGAPFEIKVRARNTGQAIWLPSDAQEGPVRLGTKLLDATGQCLIDNFWRNHLPDRHAVFPGEIVAFEGQVPSPPKGRYLFDFDLVADGVAWFNVAGASGIRIAIEVI